LIVSDGGDNHSRYSEREVRNLAKEADVVIYGIGLYDNFFETLEERLGPVIMDRLSTLTGGRTFIIQDPRDLIDAANTIAVELRNLYMISYTPIETLRDGKWRKIRVKLVLPNPLRALQLHAREGYYAPAE
jgi:Ca-activated chloride channel family protein